MGARKKSTKKVRSRDRVPDYPLLTLQEFGSLNPQEKLRYVEFLRHSARAGDSGALDTLFEKAPDLIKQGIEIYSKHVLERTRLTHWALWIHLGVLAVGTAAIVLGLKDVLDSATIVAILGPLYTYVLVNLRQLCAQRVLKDGNGE